MLSLSCDSDIELNSNDNVSIFNTSSITSITDKYISTSTDTSVLFSDTDSYTDMNSLTDNDIEKGLKNKENISNLVDIIPFENKRQYEFDRELKKSRIRVKERIEKLFDKRKNLSSVMFKQGALINEIKESSQLDNNQLIDAYLQHKN